MIRLLIAFLILTHFFQLQAQQHSYGISMGYTQATTVRPSYDYYTSVSNPTLSIFQGFQKLFYTRTTFGYMGKGFTQSVIFTDEAGNILGEGYPETHRHHYLHLGQFAGLSIGKKIYTQLTIGGSIFFYTFSKIKLPPVTLNNGDNYSGYTISHSDIENLDLSLATSNTLGIRFDSLAIFLNARYDYGVRSINNRSYKSEFPWKNRNFTVEIGIQKDF